MSTKQMDMPATSESGPVTDGAIDTGAAAEDTTKSNEVTAQTASKVQSSKSLKDLMLSSEGADDHDVSRAPPLTPQMQQAVDELRVLQKSHEEFENEYIVEWNQLKLKYLEKFRPLYAKRYELLCSKAVTDQPATENKSAPVGTVSLPNFWMIAMKNHRQLADLIHEHDEQVLGYLVDIKSEWLDDAQQTGFKLTFLFAENPYFENKELTKTYNMEKDENGEGVLTSTEGSTITWRSGKNVTKVTYTKKQKNIKTKQIRIVKEEKTVDSFFDFFKSCELPSPEQFDRMDDEEMQTLEDEVEAEFEIGCILRERIIPRALKWFMGEEDDDISEDDSDDDSGHDDSDNDNDDYDDDDDDSDDNDDVSPRFTGHKGRRGH